MDIWTPWETPFAVGDTVVVTQYTYPKWWQLWKKPKSVQIRCRCIAVKQGKQS